MKSVSGCANLPSRGFAQSSVPVPPPLPLARIVSEPLPDLLGAVNGEVVEDEDLDDPRLFGGFVERRDTGRLLFAMPPRRPVGERDRWVRVLLAHREGYGQEAVQSAFRVALHEGPAS